MSEIDRESLFANERLLIGMLQAISGASVVATISQWDALVKHARIYGVLIFLTAMAIALMLAVLAAFWKHEYKKWDVKASISRQNADNVVGKVHHEHLRPGFLDEAQERFDRASRYLTWMRKALLSATAIILFAIGELITFVWLNHLGVLAG